MANKNFTLNNAKKNKSDEFYTQYIDIKNECDNYIEQFEDKIIYCPCDDYQFSNFYKYFYDNFLKLKLKKFVCTYYIKDGHPLKTEIVNCDGKMKVTQTNLDGDGDFRSDECINLLREADIVITNPPFSLFKELVTLLKEYNKNFLLIGTINALTYEPLFNLVKENKARLGYGFKGLAGYFINQHYDDYATSSSHKEGMIRVSGVVWWTTLSTNKIIPFITLTKPYSPSSYPKYDEYDAINVNKTIDIPFDYGDTMGVPLTFLTKYNPQQFKILDLLKPKYRKINNKKIYARIIIRKR